MTGIELMARERARQVYVEGYSPEHDDGHTDGTLAVIAAALACDGTDAMVVDRGDRGTLDDPWGLISKHGYAVGGNEIRKLVIAGALIAAEIDRVMRASVQETACASPLSQQETLAGSLQHKQEK